MERLLAAIRTVGVEGDVGPFLPARRVTAGTTRILTSLEALLMTNLQAGIARLPRGVHPVCTRHGAHIDSGKGGSER